MYKPLQTNIVNENFLHHTIWHNQCILLPNIKQTNFFVFFFSYFNMKMICFLSFLPLVIFFKYWSYQDLNRTNTKLKFGISTVKKNNTPRYQIPHMMICHVLKLIGVPTAFQSFLTGYGGYRNSLPGALYLYHLFPFSNWGVILCFNHFDCRVLIPGALSIAPFFIILFISLQKAPFPYSTYKFILNFNNVKYILLFSFCIYYILYYVIPLFIFCMHVPHRMSEKWTERFQKDNKQTFNFIRYHFC